MHFFRVGTLAIMAFFCMAANLHWQTSASNRNGLLKLTLFNQPFLVDLNNSQVRAIKTEEGYLKSVSFSLLTKVYDVTFYPAFPYPKENIASIKVYEWFGSQLLLNGPSVLYNKTGQLLSETNWKEGRLHGNFFLFNEAGHKIIERFYENGLPIGTWSLYYPNGKKASEVIFPEHSNIWLKTVVVTNIQRKRLKQMRPHEPFKTTQVWYDEKGFKQREINFTLYFQDRQHFRAELTSETSYDRQGRVIATSLSQSQKETVEKVFLSGLFVETVDTLLIDKELFKSSETKTFK